jgi:hypothetical protein
MILPELSEHEEAMRDEAVRTGSIRPALPCAQQDEIQASRFLKR